MNRLTAVLTHWLLLFPAIPLISSGCRLLTTITLGLLVLTFLPGLAGVGLAPAAIAATTLALATTATTVAATVVSPADLALGAALLGLAALSAIATTSPLAATHLNTPA